MSVEGVQAIPVSPKGNSGLWRNRFFVFSNQQLRPERLTLQELCRTGRGKAGCSFHFKVRASLMLTSLPEETVSLDSPTPENGHNLGEILSHVLPDQSKTRNEVLTSVTLGFFLLFKEAILIFLSFRLNCPMGSASASSGCLEISGETGPSRYETLTLVMS